MPVAGTHLGFILNRASAFKLNTLFPGHEPSAKVIDPVYFGGPETSEAIFAVVRGDPGEKALHLFGELFVASNVGGSAAPREKGMRAASLRLTPW